MQTILIAWTYLTGLWILYLTFRAVRFFNLIELLKDIEPLRAPKSWPLVSMIIPACNEATTIGPAIRSLKSLDYPNLEIILINDRSTDETGEVMKQLAQEDTRIRLVEIQKLPPGWLGKVHALMQGEKIASGEWLLFTDADVHHGEKSLKRAITVCEQRTLDFLCVTPSFFTRTAALKIFIAQFLQTVAASVNLHKINDPETPDCVGGGAYNLARRDLLRRSKGLEWLRLEVVDDIALSKTMKEAGAKLGVMSGVKEIEIEWYPNLWAFVKGLEKNTFSVFEFSLAAVIGFALFSWIIVAGLTFVPWLSGDLSSRIFVFASTILYMSLVGMNLPKVLEAPPWMTVFFPLTSLLNPLIVLRAALIAKKQGGVYWRNTFYPLDELIKHQRLKPLRFMFGLG